MIDTNGHGQTSVVPAGAARCLESQAGLHLITGPANSGKLGRVMSWWREHRLGRPVLVVPTAAVAGEVTRELLRRTGAVIAQAPALTFDGLVREMLGARPAYISEFQRRLLIGGVLSAMRLSALGPAVGFPGLAPSVLALLQQIAESGKDQGELDRLLLGWARREPGEAALADDLRRISSAYAQAVASLGAVDRSVAVSAAELCTEDWSRPTAFYGFTSFTGAQRRLIERLTRRVPVLITFDHEHGRPANLVEEAEVERWRLSAAEIEVLPPQARAYSSPAIAYLERHLPIGDLGAAPSTGAEGVRFLLAGGERSEAEAVAQHIAELLAGGFAPADIAVIVRNPAHRGRLLAQVFDSCEIPYRLDAALTLAQTGLGHSFLSAVRSVATEDAELLLAHLRSPYSGLSWEETADLELRYRRSPGGGFKTLTGLMESEMPREFASIRRGLVADALGQALDPSGLRLLARDLLLAGLDAGNTGDACIDDDALAFAALNGALIDLQKVFSSPALAGRPSMPTVLDCLAEVRVQGHGSLLRQGVSILTPARARARRFAAVFILGLVEGEFPAGVERSSLLTETQREQLEAVGGVGLFAQTSEDEEALFLNAVSRAWQVLYLSARDADDGGGEVLPSRFWTQAKHLLGRGKDEHEKRTLSDVVFTPESAPTLKHYRRAWAAESAGAGDRSWKRTPAHLRDPGVLAVLRAMECFSPSALESYLGCPLAWFLRRVVRVGDLAPELDGRAVGDLLHGALSRVYRLLSDEGRTPLRPQDAAWAIELGRAAVDELVAGGECPGTAGERRVVSWRVKELAATALLMEAECRSRLVTTDTEALVGDPAGVDIGGLRLRGRVDRIDADPAEGGVFIVDYKSGHIPSSSRIGTEEGLQLPLYLLAVGVERGAPPLLGGAYLSAGERKRSGFIMADQAGVLGLSSADSKALRHLSQEEAGEVYASALALAVKAADAMRAGHIAPLPDRSCPSWCDLRTACRSYKGRAGS